MDPPLTHLGRTRLYRRRRNGLSRTALAPERRRLAPSRTPSPGNQGEPLALPNTQKPKRTHTRDKDGEFVERRCETSQEVATTFERAAPLDYGGAIGHSMTHCPEYSELYELEPCNMFRRQDIFPDVALENLPARHTFARNPKVDPMSRTLTASGAVIVDAQGWFECVGKMVRMQE